MVLVSAAYVGVVAYVVDDDVIIIVSDVARRHTTRHVRTAILGQQ